MLQRRYTKFGDIGDILNVTLLLISDNIRHFTDNLILARLEAEEEEGSEVLQSLTDTHIIQTISDIFFGIWMFFINRSLMILNLKSSLLLVFFLFKTVCVCHKCLVLTLVRESNCKGFQAAVKHMVNRTYKIDCYIFEARLWQYCSFGVWGI